MHELLIMALNYKKKKNEPHLYGAFFLHQAQSTLLSPLVHPCTHSYDNVWLLTFFFICRQLISNTVIWETREEDVVSVTVWNNLRMFGIIFELVELKDRLQREVLFLFFLRKS